MKKRQTIHIPLHAAAFLLAVGMFMVTADLSSQAAPVRKTEGDFTYDEENAQATIVAYNGQNSSVVIPDQLGEAAVTAISDSIFSETETTITSVSLPDSVTDVAAFTFYDMPSLTTVRWSSGASAIADNVFSDSSLLTSVTNTAQVVSVGAYAFDDCTGLKSISLPLVTEIGASAFRSTALTSISFPALTKLGRGVFEDAAALKKVSLGETITTIPVSTFEGCSSLTKFSVPASVTKIREAAFFRSGLKHITAPKTVKLVESWAFASCPNLQTAKWNSGAEILTRVFADNKLLREVTIKGPVIKVASRAFEDCKTLKTVIFPNCIRSISSKAFTGCTKLKKISGYTGSKAQTFAKKNSLGFTAVGTNILPAPKISKIQPVNGRKISVTFKKVSKAKGYSVEFSQSKTFKTVKTKKLTGTSAVSGKLTKGTWYVRVRAYRYDAVGKVLYGKYSKKVKVKIKN